MGSSMSRSRSRPRLTDDEARALLQRKICLAEDSPEPVYDLSECQLSRVPSGTYAMCKVLRKRRLLLQENMLSCITSGGQLCDLQLLRELRLSGNRLTRLPADISQLVNLQVLDVGENALKLLPVTVGQLARLRQLLCADNHLLRLPDSLTRLSQLSTLDVRHNRLNELPTLSSIPTLRELRLEGNANLTSPPESVVKLGSEAVILFLCKEMGVERVEVGSEDAADVDDLGDEATGENSRQPSCLPSPDRQENITENIDQYQKLKDNKRQDLVELERRNKQTNLLEGQEMARQEQMRKELVSSLTAEQARVDTQLAQLSEQRDADRNRLLQHLCRIEQRTDDVTARIAAASVRMRDPQTQLDRLQADRRQLEQLVAASLQHDQLRRQEISECMVQLLRETFAAQSHLQSFDQGRDKMLQHTIQQDHAMDVQLRQLMRARNEEQEVRVQQLIKDEQLQRQAFYNLYLQQDTSRHQIMHQIQQAEHALMQLSLIENRQREAQKNIELERLSEKRSVLTALLMQLIEQRVSREQQLQQTLMELDSQRERTAHNYWLVQFQRLMDMKPAMQRDKERAMDCRVRQLLLDCGAEAFTARFATADVNYKTLIYMTDGELKAIGVHDLATRTTILGHVDKLRDSDSEIKSDLKSPSAPEFTFPLDGTGDVEGASAPGLELTTHLHMELECVVCMERQTEVIFLVCGHTCTCCRCSSTLLQCPMCRQNISQKLVMFRNDQNTPPMAP